jgi:hypothetical protein
MRVRWTHDFPYEPVLIYWEIQGGAMTSWSTSNATVPSPSADLRRL